MKKMRFVLLFVMRKFVSLSLAEPALPSGKHEYEDTEYFSCAILQYERQQLVYKVDETQFQLQISEYPTFWRSRCLPGDRSPQATPAPVCIWSVTRLVRVLLGANYQNEIITVIACYGEWSPI